MKKEILNRGYVTHMLTDGKRKIFGIMKDTYISNWQCESKHYYWSEVYVEPGHMATIIRKGMLLSTPTNEELSRYHEQSKVNFLKD